MVFPNKKQGLSHLLDVHRCINLCDRVWKSQETNAMMENIKPILKDQPELRSYVVNKNGLAL